MYCKPPSLKRVKIKRFTILGIDLVSQTNKLKKYRIVRLFKKKNKKILEKKNGKLVTPLPPPPPIPQIKDGKINQSFILTRYVKELKNSFKIRACIHKKWRVVALRAGSFLVWGNGGLLFHFIPSIVGLSFLCSSKLKK